MLCGIIDYKIFQCAVAGCRLLMVIGCVAWFGRLSMAGSKCCGRIFGVSPKYLTFLFHIWTQTRINVTSQQSVMFDVPLKRKMYLKYMEGISR